MIKRAMAAVLALCMAAAFGVGAMAASFSDLISPFHDWAAEQIEEMTILGIIKGYSDGTYRPDQEIKKIEALVLVARAAGFTNENYSDFTAYASELYSLALEDYDIDYKDEISFLLYKGILSEDELDDYIGEDEYSTSLLRYEAAILFTKLLGAEEEVKAATVTVLDYTDAAQIPASAKPYVEYVTEQSIMNGVYDIEKPDEQNFSPNTAVTRAQAAVLLHRVLEKTDLSVSSGIVTQVEDDTISYREASGVIERVSKGSAVKLTVNGAQDETDAIKVGSYIALIYSGDSLIQIETFTQEADEVIEGQVTAITDNRISIKPPSSSTSRTAYFADSVSVTYDGVASVLSAIKVDDYVSVSIKNNRATAIAAQTPTNTYIGTVTAMDISGVEVVMTVETSDEEMEFTVPDSASVNKNGSAASLSQVLVGDRVSVTVTYGAVSAIRATNTKSTAVGIITEINIATQSSIKVRVSDEVVTYPLSLTAEIYVSDVEADIYSLRLGQSVTLNLEGGTITSVYAKASAVSGQYTGTVKSVNTNYGYIQLSITESDATVSDRQIFVEKSGSSVTAKIYNSATGRDVSLSTIKEGDSITVVGSTTNGAFVASTILILP